MRTSASRTAPMSGSSKVTTTSRPTGLRILVMQAANADWVHQACTSRDPLAPVTTACCIMRSLRGLSALGVSSGAHLAPVTTVGMRARSSWLMAGGRACSSSCLRSPRRRRPLTLLHEFSIEELLLLTQPDPRLLIFVLLPMLPLPAPLA